MVRVRTCDIERVYLQLCEPYVHILNVHYAQVHVRVIDSLDHTPIVNTIDICHSEYLVTFVAKAHLPALLQRHAVAGINRRICGLC